MLAQQVIGEVDGDVEFVVEDFGKSELADRLGVTQYPAIFIDDVLVATPRDFYGWGMDEPGRYMPWREQASRDRFVADFRRMLRLRLAGESLEARAIGPDADLAADRLPPLTATTLDGDRLDTAALEGRVVVVEFFASWCPPCKPTLAWLERLAESHGDDVVVLAFALQSGEDDVRELVGEPGRARVAMATTETADRFGGVLAVPTLMVFDRDGENRATYYGAPPDLETRVRENVRSLLEAP